jgi:hypothetical protein
VNAKTRKNCIKGSSSALSTSSPSWNPLTRIAFRLGFCYLMLYALCCGNATVWLEIPFIGGRLEGLLASPFQHAALWAGRHVFRLQGLAAVLHPSGYNDRALDYVAAAVMLLLSILAATAWSILDRKRTEYNTLLLWLRFTLRLTVAVAMMIYGWMKLIPIQVAPPSLAVLNEAVGQTSPLSLLWTTISLNPIYEQLTGCVEMLCGVLLFYRRTALAGAMLSAFVMLNVLLFDCFFDVPVKLYAAMLLLMCVVMMLPDAGALVRFFWTHEAATTRTAWAPVLRRRWQWGVVGVEVGVALMSCLVVTPLNDWQRYAPEAASLRHPSSLSGQWHVEAATPAPFVVEDGSTLTDVFLEPAGRVTARAADGTLWTGTRYDEARRVVWMWSPLRRRLTYAIQQTDAEHLVLVPAADAAGYPTLRLTRVALPQRYPLLDRGFHWVNEFGYER